MSSQTVATTGSRISIGSLPSLNTPQSGDTVLGLQNGKAGLFPLSSLGGGTGPVSGYATTTALSNEAQIRQKADDTLNQKLDGIRAAIPGTPDLSGYMKKADASSFVSGAQLEAAINGLHIPSTDGLAQQADLAAETTARQQADTILGQRIDGLGQRIDALPTSGTSSGTGSSGPVTITSLPTWHGSNKAPVRLFGTIQDDGGAYNSSTVAYPGGVTFKYPPIITGKTYIILFDDWGNGATTTVSDLVIQSVSRSGFTFQHVGPWPGNGQEWIIYNVEGIPN
ncbi:hypothetical protein NQF86_00230 [Bombella sp. TMW 2.2543]|uniref:Tail fiber protein n=1 Tax=Bombella pluederhausensis TaxID=2967336 RepID=A0ABT3WH39_9PROT|nr:hypothetical protein [Bombella pluederhausensis]MCX5617099.1 hypothetical protein [Bombella pluederhausensis]